MAYIARTDGTREEIPLQQAISLEYAQQVIGGYVERVCPRQSPGIVFLCDEDGLSKNLPLNPEGCRLYGHTSPVVGTLIVMTRKEARGWL